VAQNKPQMKFISRELGKALTYKKLSYWLGTARRESLPKIAEMEWK